MDPYADSIADVPGFEYEIGKDPLFDHWGRLGYRTFLHLASILATPYVYELLERYPRVGQQVSVESLCSKAERHLQNQYKRTLSLSDGGGPELSSLYPNSPEQIGGWVSSGRGGERKRQGRSLPQQMQLPVPDPPPTDDRKTSLPPEVRLQGWPDVKDQGLRGTCVAFAVADLYLGACLKEGRNLVSLSVQYLYALAKREMKLTSEGSESFDGITFGAALDAMKEFGACPQEYLRYAKAHDFGQYYHIDPPDPPIHSVDDLRDRARDYRIKSFRPVRLTADAVKRELFNKRAVAVGLPLYEIAWGNAFAALTGEVSMPLTLPDPNYQLPDDWDDRPETFAKAGLPLPDPNHEVPADRRVGGHAIALIGYRDKQGAFLFRNSWGESWAKRHHNRQGHGWLPYAYLERCAQEAYVIDELS